MHLSADFHRSDTASGYSFNINWPQSVQIMVFGSHVGAAAVLRVGSGVAAVKISISISYCYCYRLGRAGMAVHGHRIAKRSHYLHVCAGNSRPQQAVAAAELGYKASGVVQVSYYSVERIPLML